MWVAVGRGGRVITAENRQFDPTHPDFIQRVKDRHSDLERGQFIEQRAEAREYAEQMSSTGGR
jgi:hypothetical protein